jgi:hypothetical protein
MYTIEKILDKQGNERTDGHYPRRKGCQVKIFHLKDGECMILEYAKDADGNPKFGYLRTSIVKNHYEDAEKLVVLTMNSTYYLKKEKANVY